MRSVQLVAFALSLLVVSGAASNGTTPETGLPPCDALIRAGLANRLLMPTNRSFETNVASYWSMNARVRPWCILQPRNSHEVSVALKSLVDAGEGAGNWHIALRSGGHSAQGTNGIENGVTIDLSLMNHTVFDEATKTARIEPGARWMNVYADLEKYAVTASGGRDGGVGVGGFLTGGGNTYYAGRTGFGCDTVVNFEVVLANGSIIDANSTAHADLWTALKGGSSNFGVVTRFDVTTVSTHQQISYLRRIVSSDQSERFIEGLVRYNSASNDAPDDAIIAFYTHQAAAPGIFIYLIEVNTRGRNDSSTFNELNQIPFLNSTHVEESPAEAAIGSQVPAGTWNAGSTVTFRNDPRIVKRAVELHAEYVEFLTQRVGAENFTTECFFQPVPKLYGQIGRNHGGNMLGLPTDEDVFIWTGGVGLTTNAMDLAVAHEGLRAMSAKITDFAKSVDGHVDLVYLNYADTSQDPLGSYPLDSIKLIREVAARYDPTGVFQTRIPGGFKVSRVSKGLESTGEDL